MVKSKVLQMFGGDAYMAKQYHIRFFGDATAGALRDPSAHLASWSIIRDSFRDWTVELRLSRQNPRIGDRREIVNSRLQTADGKVHCQISPKCKYLINDFEQMTVVDFADGNKERAGKDVSHASDGFGYMCWVLWRTKYRIYNTQIIPV
jgi:hypothetical protein